ncbi:MAG: adenylate kinase [Clostridia bacterium]|nr:adenylate kinase [Clostridia bacterium]
MKLIMLGAPGAGKGTQAIILSERYEIPTISTGVIIRAAIKNGTETGKMAKDYIEKGQLVPDSVVIGIIKERLAEDDCKNGFILDGFPRTIPQAQALDEFGIEIDKVLDIEVPDEAIVERLSGRRECSKCGATYHLSNNPSKKGDKCERCEGDLVCRKDDAPETVLSRLEVYHSQTEPLIEFYKNKGILYVADGTKGVEATTKEIISVLEA